MANIRQEIGLDLSIKGNGAVVSAINSIIQSQKNLAKGAEATAAQQVSLADAFKKTDFALKRFGKGAKDAKIGTELFAEALRGNKIAISQVKRELADYTRNLSKGQSAINELKIELRHYGVSVKKVTNWENLRKQALQGSTTAVKLLRKEVKKATIVQKKHNQKLRSGIFGFRNLRNATTKNAVAFSVFRSKLLLATFAIGMFDRAIVSLIKSYGKQELGLLKVGRTLISTGMAAGITRKEIIELTKHLQRTGVVGDEVNLQMASLMLTYTRIGKEVFPRAMKAANDMATSIAGGIPTTEDLRSKVTMLSKALQDPIRGMTALRKVGFTLTQTQKELVKSLQNSGDIMAAQNVILKAAELQYGDMAEKIKTGIIGQLNDLSMAWGDASEVLGKFLADQLMPFLGQITRLGEAMDSRRVTVYATALESAAATMAVYVLWTRRAVIAQSRLGWGLLLTSIGLVATEIMLAQGAFKDWGAELNETNNAFGMGAERGRDFAQRVKELGGTTADVEQNIAQLEGKLTLMAQGSLPQVAALFTNGKAIIGAYAYSAEQLAGLIAGLRASLTQMAEAQAILITKFEDQIEVLNESNPITKEQIKIANKLGIELEELDPALEKIIEDYHNLVAVKKAEIVTTQAGIEITKAEKEARLEAMSTLSSATEEFLMFDNQRHLDSEKSKLQAELDANEASRKSDRAKGIERDRIEKKIAALEKQQHNRQLTIKQLNIAIDTALGIARIKIAQSSAEALIRAKYALIPGGTVIAEAEITALRAMNAISIGSAVAGGAIGIAGIQAQKYARGGDFITNRPELIQVGEAGRERVTITPVDRPESRALGSMGGVNINFSGNVLSQDFIEDEAIPMIKEAIRRGADIGVA